ncbi:hypothetical protein BCR42DRAFT_402923 [Absidia repens]|uniref:Uncharacterized protein n=1 Tax=Absidia repens TaxID=90262 RepID=A0A1X2J0B6_9FUNG|nr:hypothetical protein BCR42DRAFT_402923 [Absidia repens]
MLTAYSQSPPPHHDQQRHGSPGNHSRQPPAHSPYPAPMISSMTPGSSPTGSPARKPPKLRVHIPEVSSPPQHESYQHKRTASSSSSVQSVHNNDNGNDEENTRLEVTTTTTKTTMIENESSKQHSTTITTAESRKTKDPSASLTVTTGGGNDERGPPSAGPPSALPSQFAQNLPSPSSFYPDFFQQSELPSPLNFSATPTVGHTFHWPATSRDYKPSPLAKLGGEQMKRPIQEETEDSEERNLDGTVSKKQKA